MKTVSKIQLVLAAAVAAAIVPAAANASISIAPSNSSSMALAYVEGTNTAAVVYDNQSGDLDASTANMSVQDSNTSASPDWNGTFSAYTTSTSSSAIIQGLQLAFRNNTSSEQTITIEVTEVGFTVPGSNNVSLLNELSGTLTNAAANDKVTFTSYADSANGWGTVTGPSTPVSSYTATGSTPTNPLQSFAEPNTMTSFTKSGPYSLTDVLTITLAGGASGNISDTTQTVAAPEPASLAMLGLGGAGLLLVRRRNASKA